MNDGLLADPHVQGLLDGRGHIHPQRVDADYADDGFYGIDGLAAANLERLDLAGEGGQNAHAVDLMVHDFPLPMHVWSFDAAVNARWFDTKGKKIGDDYRAAVFAAQPTIHNQADLRSLTEKFALSHQISLPFVVDPQKQLSDAVKADYALGQRIGIEHTPTIWVVTNKTNGVPFVEIVDRTKLYEIIDTALAETKSTTSQTVPARGKVMKAAAKK